METNETPISEKEEAWAKYDEKKLLYQLACDVYDAARSAAWNAAHNASRNATHLISGLPHNPWTPLMEIGALGCAPVGVINNEFVVYVPEVK